MLGGLEALIAGSVAALAAIIAVAWKAYSAGKASAQLDAANARIKAREAADEIEEAVAGNDPAKNRKELAKWARR